MAKVTTNRFIHSALFIGVVVAGATACSSDMRSVTAPAVAQKGTSAAAVATSQTFVLSSVTPPITCTDASGAVTTVTGGTLALSSNGKFTATFETQTTSAAGSTTSSYTEKGSFTRSGSTIVFKVSGVGTFAGTIDGGTITIADYPYCGETHTAIFTQV